MDSMSQHGQWLCPFAFFSLWFFFFLFIVEPSLHSLYQRASLYVFLCPICALCWVYLLFSAFFLSELATPVLNADRVRASIESIFTLVLGLFLVIDILLPEIKTSRVQ